MTFYSVNFTFTFYLTTPLISPPNRATTNISLCRVIRLRSALTGRTVVALHLKLRGEGCLNEAISSTQRQAANWCLISLRVAHHLDSSGVWLRPTTWLEKYKIFYCTSFISPVYETRRVVVMTRSKSPPRCTVGSWGIPRTWRNAMKTWFPAFRGGRDVSGSLPTQRQSQRPGRGWWRLDPDLGARLAVTCRARSLNLTSAMGPF